MTNSGLPGAGYSAPLPKWSTETFDQEGVEDPVQQPPTVPGENNRGGDSGSNIVERIDVTKIANDGPDDSDYDDPYPGGPTPSLSVEIGG